MRYGVYSSSSLQSSLILGYLRLRLQPCEGVSGLKEDFVKGLDVEMMYEVMIAADAIHLRDLLVACASAFVNSTYGWENKQIDEYMPIVYKEGWRTFKRLQREYQKFARDLEGRKLVTRETVASRHCNFGLLRANLLIL